MNPMFNRNASAAYAKVGIEIGIESASPHKLILMLMEGALVALATAKLQVEQRNIAAKGRAITRAVAIINEGLKPSLNIEAGGEIAENLQLLYDYMTRRLLEANIQNQIQPLDEVAKLLSELKSAWEAIGKPHPAELQAAQPNLSRPAASYGKV